MVSIENSKYKSPQLVLLHQWFVAEWGEGDFFQTRRYDKNIPAPLIALKGEQLVGGLSFTRYPNPDADTIEIWVNALLISPKFRGQNIAHQLIQHAQQTVCKLNENYIFARTAVPQLYMKSGWEMLKSDGADQIMIKRLNIGL